MIFGEKLNVEECFGVVRTKYVSDKLKSEERKLKSVKLKGKTAVILCGNNTKSPVKAEEYNQHFFDWIKDSPLGKEVTAYSIYYTKVQPLLTNLTPNPLFDYEGLARILFEPVIYDRNDILPAEEVAKKLGNITFFGHSVGGYVMNELMYRFGVILDELNYSSKDIKKILDSVVFIGYSPYELVDAPIKNIYVAPIYDSVGSTKKVCDRILNGKDVVPSNSKINMKEVCDIQAISQLDFIEKYKKATLMKDVVYFMDKSTLIATPDILIDDGIKEDHNLAGVIEYPTENAYKTNAGNLTTEFMKRAIKYSLGADRQKFSIQELFNNAVQYTNNIEENKVGEEL